MAVTRPPALESAPAVTSGSQAARGGAGRGGRRLRPGTQGPGPLHPRSWGRVSGGTGGHTSAVARLQVKAAQAASPRGPGAALLGRGRGLGARVWRRPCPSGGSARLRAQRSSLFGRGRRRRRFPVPAPAGLGLPAPEAPAAARRAPPPLDFFSFPLSNLVRSEIFSLCSVPAVLSLFFFKILFIYSETQREREAETRAEGEAGSMQGA